jgi:Fe-S-cluster-containing hydrogenase component 2
MRDHPIPVRLPRVLAERCQACRPCLARQACRAKALRIVDPGEAPFVDGSRCYGCLACLPACPFEAIVAYMQVELEAARPAAPRFPCELSEEAT